MAQAARRLTAKDTNEKLAHRRMTVLELAERLGNVTEACRRGGIDRGRPGSKRHILVDAGGIPLALLPTPANVHDSTMLEPVLDTVPPIRQCAGRPRKRSAKLHADKGYDYARCRRACRARGVVARIARRGVETSERLGRHRWVVERTLAWFARFRRLEVRGAWPRAGLRPDPGERRADIFEGFHHLAAALICLRSAERWFCQALLDASLG